MNKSNPSKPEMSLFPQPFAGALNLVHLARQSAGDVALERELLSLFGSQARAIVAQLSANVDADNALQRAELVHRLRGSALAVGAEGVADAARICENHLKEFRGLDPKAPCFAALGQAVALADEMIDALLAA